jgi:hypothetical protein
MGCHDQGIEAILVTFESLLRLRGDALRMQVECRM